jgi:hypothetical protein
MAGPSAVRSIRAPREMASALSESAPAIAPCLIATAPAVKLCGSIQGLRAGAAQQPDQRRSALAYKYRQSTGSITDPARRNLRDESLELPMVAREELTFRNGRETVRPRQAACMVARDPMRFCGIEALDFSGGALNESERDRWKLISAYFAFSPVPPANLSAYLIHYFPRFLM